MMFDLAEAGLNIIEMDDDVVIRIRDPEVVCPGKDFFTDFSNSHLSFEHWGMEVIELMGVESQSFLWEASKLW